MLSDMKSPASVQKVDEIDSYEFMKCLFSDEWCSDVANKRQLKIIVDILS